MQQYNLVQVQTIDILLLIHPMIFVTVLKLFKTLWGGWYRFVTQTGTHDCSPNFSEINQGWFRRKFLYGRKIATVKIQITDFEISLVQYFVMLWCDVIMIIISYYVFPTQLRRNGESLFVCSNLNFGSNCLDF